MAWLQDRGAPLSAFVCLRLRRLTIPVHPVTTPRSPRRFLLVESLVCPNPNLLQERLPDGSLENRCESRAQQLQLYLAISFLRSFPGSDISNTLASKTVLASVCLGPRSIGELSRWNRWRAHLEVGNVPCLQTRYCWRRKCYQRPTRSIIRHPDIGYGSP